MQQARYEPMYSLTCLSSHFTYIIVMNKTMFTNQIWFLFIKDKKYLSTHTKHERIRHFLYALFANHVYILNYLRRNKKKMHYGYFCHLLRQSLNWRLCETLTPTQITWTLSFEMINILLNIILRINWTIKKFLMISCLFKRKRYMITCIFLYFTMYFRFTTVMRNINTLQQNFKPATDLKIICIVKYFVLLLHNT